MRITHIITRLIVGGAQENAIASVLGLQAKPGVTVRLVAGPALGPEGNLESELRNFGVDLQVIPSLVRPLHPWKDWQALRALTVLLRQDFPDIVHTHSGKAGILGRLAAHRAGVPIVVHTIHGPSFGPFQGAFSNCLFRAAERWAGRYTTVFVSVAEAMTRRYLEAGIGRPEQFTCIYSGFDLGPFLSAKNDPAVRARWGLAKSDFVVGKIARLTALKGHDDLIAIAPGLVQRYPQIRFLLVGDGPWRPRLENKIRKACLEKYFVFTGLVPPAQIPELVGIMDVLAHLSRREGLPRAVSQALAAGRPVVAYDCDGAGEVCLHDQTGFLVWPGDFNDLTARLIQFIEDRTLRERFGQAGQRLVQKNFSVQRMVEDLYAFYERLLRSAQRSGPLISRP